MGKLTIDRGTSYAISGTYLDSDGVAVDITSSDIRFTVKSTEWDTDADDSDALITADGTIVSGADGTYLISLTPTDTQVDAGKYYYDIKIDVDGDGTDIKRLDKGRVTIDGSPTNRTS
jgi:hypothetical protein